MMSIDNWILYLRDEERRARSLGLYERAVQCQQCADYAEDHDGDHVPYPSWFQRGIDRFPKVYGFGDLIGFRLPNTSIWWITKDVARDVLQTLLVELGLAPDDRPFTMEIVSSKENQDNTP